MQRRLGPTEPKDRAQRIPRPRHAHPQPGSAPDSRWLSWAASPVHGGQGEPSWGPAAAAPSPVLWGGAGVWGWDADLPVSSTPPAPAPPQAGAQLSGPGGQRSVTLHTGAGAPEWAPSRSGRLGLLLSNLSGSPVLAPPRPRAGLRLFRSAGPRFWSRRQVPSRSPHACAPHPWAWGRAALRPPALETEP